MSDIYNGPGFRLICGDSLKIMPHHTNCYDLIVSDPPYLLTSGGMTEGGMHERFGGGGTYDNSGNFFQGECPDWSEFMPLMFDCLVDNAQCYTMSDSKNVQAMLNAGEEAGFSFHNLLCWRKGTYTANRWYMKGVEFTALHFKGKAFQINACGSKQDVYVPQIDESEHPTEKPVLLMKMYIENSSQPGQVVFDPFMGTGTTGVAAINSGRKFVGIENDRRWFDVACERLQSAADNLGKQTMDLFSL
jgi:site-specific DNA-methyltransferase (adenine-specific)